VVRDVWSAAATSETLRSLSGGVTVEASTRILYRKFQCVRIVKPNGSLSRQSE
jgi:hypothetical protein